jgi:hypothetical protein
MERSIIPRETLPGDSNPAVDIAIDRYFRAMDAAQHPWPNRLMRVHHRIKGSYDSESKRYTLLGLGAAISAQDKNTLKVPGGLGFSEFQGL